MSLRQQVFPYSPKFFRVRRQVLDKIKNISHLTPGINGPRLLLSLIRCESSLGKFRCLQLVHRIPPRPSIRDSKVQLQQPTAPANFIYTEYLLYTYCRNPARVSYLCQFTLRQLQLHTISHRRWRYHFSSISCYKYTPKHFQTCV